MSNSVNIQITRRTMSGNAYAMLVEVFAGDTEYGYNNGYSYPLTLEEETEARRLLVMEGISDDEEDLDASQIDDEPEPHYWRSTVREDAHAANACFGHRGEMADRRAQ